MRQFPQHSANRLVGQGVNLPQASRVYYFGPFRPGEYVEAVRLHVGYDTAVSTTLLLAVHLFALASVQSLTSTTTEATLAALGRDMLPTVGGETFIIRDMVYGYDAAATTRVGGLTYDIPIGWRATDHERYLALRLNPGSTLTVHGNVCVVMARDQE
jgi:hypothetical protein